MFEWNVAYNFIMNIKRDFVAAFGTREFYNLKEMVAALDKPEYNHFINCVKVTQNAERYPSFALVKYSLIGKEQPDLDNPESMFREMRSLVVDLDREEIVLAPFRKFFNINELPETNMNVVAEKIANAKTVEISNKLDGSMQQARWYLGKLVYTGSSSMTPSESFQLEEGLDVFNSNPAYLAMVRENPDYTFIFEYTSPNNLIVVRYDETKLSLIGVRDVKTGRQLTYREMVTMAEKYALPHTEVETRTFAEVVGSVGTYAADEKEGWVLYVDGEMFKMKCDDYREVHRILSFVSAPNVLMRAIADDYFDDVIAKVPDAYKENLRRAAGYVYDYVHKTEQAIGEWYEKMPQGDRKAFALAVNKDVPKELRRFMFCKLNGQSYSVLKTHEHTATPHYMKLSEIIGTSNYVAFFNSIGMRNVDAEE